MTSPFPLRLLRDAAAIATVACFMFPLFWWGLTSIKPAGAIYDASGINWIDFSPSLDNYRATLAGGEVGFFASRQAILDTIIVSLGATAITLAVALPAAFALSLMAFKARRGVLMWIVFQRVLPPVAILTPLLFLYHEIGLRDTRAGVMFAHAAMNLPVALLLLKSFFDDIPREVGEAAAIDGATLAQRFSRIYLPLIRGGIAATAVLCFLFSWTEFLIGLFLTSNIRLLPVQLSLLVSQTWGHTSALSMASIAPGLIFILLVQRHLVRGLTMGLTKG